MNQDNKNKLVVKQIKSEQISTIICSTPNCPNRNSNPNHCCYECGVLLCLNCAILHYDKCVFVRELKIAQ